MNKNFFAAVLLLSAFAFHGSPLSAQETVMEHVQIGDLYYDLNTQDSTAAVTWEKKIDTTNYHGLKEAIIPASVTYNEQVYQVTAVADNAFAQCDSLTTISIPEGVTRIGQNGFRQSELIASVVIPNSVTEIGDHAFDLCIGMNYLTLGSGLKRIGAHAFVDCQNVQELIIPDNVEYIGDVAFSSFRSATRIVIGSGVKYLGERAFQKADALPAFEVAPGNTIVCAVDGVLFNMAKDTLIQYPGAKGGDYTVPATVTAIGDGSFNNCNPLNSISIPEGVTYVGTAAFAGCMGLKEVVIPNSVKRIGGTAFTACYNLGSVTLGSGLDSLGMTAFAACRKLKSVTCYAPEAPKVGELPFFQIDPDAKLYVTMEAFSKYIYAPVWKDFKIIEPLSRPGMVRAKIGDLYYNIDSVAHTAAVTWDRYQHTTNYKYLKDVIIPDSVTYAEKRYPVTAVDSMAFITAYTIETVVLPNTVTEIQYSAFMMCDSLRSITWGSGLKRIEAAALSGCHALSEIIIPDYVEYIGGSAFDYCKGATRVVIGSGVKYLGERAFQRLESLPAFEVAPGNTVVCVEDGVLFNIAKDTLIQFPGGKGGDYTVPASVTAIGDGAFQSSKHLTNVTLPEGLTYLGNASFVACTSLTEIVIPNGVTTIKGSFTECTSLKHVTIGNAVTFIDMVAFGDCKALETFTCYTVTPPALGLIPFFSVNLAAATLYVPAEAVEAYRAADTWKEFGTIAAIPAEGIDQITNDKSKMTNKIIRDGILLIEKNGKLYNAQGVEVR